MSSRLRRAPKIESGATAIEYGLIGADPHEKDPGFGPRSEQTERYVRAFAVGYFNANPPDGFRTKKCLCKNLMDL